MEIKINIEKKYVFLILVAIFAVGGFVVVAQPATQNPGHDIGEISGDIPINQVPGAARNCAFVNSPFCQPASALSWGLSDVAIASGLSARSVNSDNSDKLDNIDSTGFCQTGGAGCPSIPVIPSSTVYLLPGTSSCGSTAFLCKPASSGVGEILSRSHPSAVGGGNSFEWKSALSSWGYGNNQLCAWVLCTQSS